MSLQNAIAAVAAEKIKPHTKGEISAKTRKKTATVHAGGNAKFPIPDKKHARLALAMENQAKPPLTPAQKSAVKAKANAMLGKGK